MTGDQRDAGQDDHETLDELAVGWALHVLEPEDESAFLPHLSLCSRCARTVAETHEVMAAMASDLPAAAPSNALRDRLLAAVEDTAQEVRPAAGPPAPTRPAPPQRPEQPAGPADIGPGVVRLTGRRRADQPVATGFPFALRSGPAERPSWRRVLPNALIATGVAAILALGTWNVVLSSARDDALATAARQADVMQALLAPGRATIAPLADPDGHAVATVVAHDGQVQVVADGLGVNDTTDSTYVVWGMREGAPVPLGTFDVVHSELDLRTVGSEQTGLGDYDKYGVSLESGRRAPSAPTDILAIGAVTS